MGIDGIGKAPPSVPPSSTPPSGGGDTGFSVGETAGVEPSGALDRLERGEIGLEQYLDARVSEATAHLAGRVSAEQLDSVKETLKAELASDPVLVELVRRATGKTPEAATT